MSTGLERRLKVLEDAGGGGECPRCSGVVEVFICGEFSGASKHGKEMSKEDYRDFLAEEDEKGCCPVCQRKHTEITVGWPDAPLERDVL